MTQKELINNIKKEIEAVRKLDEEGLIGFEERDLRLAICKDDTLLRVTDAKERQALLDILEPEKDIKQDNFQVLSSLFLQLANDIKNVLNDYKNKDTKTSELLTLANKIYQKHDKKESIEILKKVFFEMKLYNKLNLKEYYEENGVCFQYNVKKERLVIFGNPNEIGKTFLEWKEEKKKEKKEISKEEKLDNDFLRISKKYDKKEIENLIKKLNEYLHKNI